MPIDVHAIASRTIQIVNPDITVQYQMSTGVGETARDGTRTPTYSAKIPRLANVQPLGTKDLRQMDALNMGGTTAALYLFGMADGIVRVRRKGGDIVTIETGPYMGVWLVTGVFEQWPTWVKCGIAQQNEAAS